MFIENINDNKKWKEFLESKLNSNFVSKKEKKGLQDFICGENYKKIVDSICNHSYSFSIPRKSIISKNHSSKKRVVYSFYEDEMMFLKYITYLLYEYDYLFQNNLYSFRKSVSVRDAVNNISKIKNINKMYGYKVDISNYFNSIDKDILFCNLDRDIKDYELLKFIKEIISNKNVLYNNKIMEEDTGVMAGVPISSFLANYYIREIDEYFTKEKVVYLRYSDDIIVFCNTKDDVIKYANILKEFLNKYKLSVNKEKEYFFNPGDKWDFLGFSFYDGVIDLSTNTINKIKAKIRRSARSIRRWGIKKQISSDKLLSVMIRKYNKKFFGVCNNELSWKYWFFPIINTSKSLKLIDKYFQDNLRYVVTGRYNKKNYKLVPYTFLKKFGYRSLVNEYYLFVNLESDM